MEIRVRADSVEISGYVNAIERKSKPLWSRMGQFVERIRKGAFKRSLEKNNDVRILLNHDPNRDLGGIKDGNLELKEDNIGLHARSIITDPEVIEKAKNGDLVGWSFGFLDGEVENKRDEDGYPLRDVKDLELREVSILDKSKTPAYDGTLVSVRSDEQSIFYGEMFADGIQVRAEETKIEETEEHKESEHEETHEEIKEMNYDKWDALISDMKA